MPKRTTARRVFGRKRGPSPPCRSRAGWVIANPVLRRTRGFFVCGRFARPGPGFSSERSRSSRWRLASPTRLRPSLWSPAQLPRRRQPQRLLLPLSPRRPQRRRKPPRRRLMQLRRLLPRPRRRRPQPPPLRLRLLPRPRPPQRPSQPQRPPPRLRRRLLLRLLRRLRPPPRLPPRSRADPPARKRPLPLRRRQPPLRPRRRPPLLRRLLRRPWRFHSINSFRRLTFPTRRPPRLRLPLRLRRPRRFRSARRPCLPSSPARRLRPL